VAMFFGLIGILFAFSPRVRGGLISTFSLVAGGIGLVVAIIKAVIWLV
jgi:hypothetical protein